MAPPELELTDAERRALHDLELGVEHLRRAHGLLLAFHHRVGHAMDRIADAETGLREEGHREHADRIRDRQLPAGVFEDRWTYELAEAFEEGLLAEVTDFEAELRAELAKGERHVAERRQRAAWRERSDGWPR